MPMEFYHAHMRTLQDRYEGRAVADRLAEHRVHAAFTEADRRFIEEAPFFFLATASSSSVDCSFKGGEPGFVRVLGESELAWPDYDGNRMYRSLGNIMEGGRVGLLFLRFDGHRFDGSAARLRVNGRASIDESKEAVADLPGARRLIRVAVDHIFPNCPRYIPAMDPQGGSVYSPRMDYDPPEPDWKSRDWVRDIFAAEKE